MNKRSEKVRAYLKFAVLVILIVGVPAYIYFFQHDLITQFSNIDSVKQIINDNNAASVPLYIAFQIIQIIICIIPGQWLQLAAGIAWGFWIGLLLSLIGALFGSILTYFLAKYLGTDALRLIFGQDKLDQLTEKLDSKAGITAVFLIYLIPGLPKDLCNYAAGVSQIKLKPFLIVSMVGRTPGMIASLLIGKHLSLGSYHVAVIIAVIAGILFVLGIIFRNKLTSFVNKVYDRLLSMQDEDK
ncbi:MAG: VTT domain-containing protein [Firmicutes bacterium]|nr:VTT domain-containing protein [Bacillota bacterium]